MDYKKLKGSLGLKSSALAPTACKLSSQFLVLDHMSNHYMKIARAKSAIDSRPPKSLATSQKMRDRMNQNRIVRSPQPRSHSSMSGTNVFEYEDILKDEPEDEEEKLVHSIMKSTLLDKARGSNKATYGSASHMDSYENEPHMFQQVQQMADDTHYYTSPYGTMVNDLPASVHSVRSGHSLASSASRVAIPPGGSVKTTCKGDVLEKRPHLFTEPERPFTPRTLKKNIESRLKHSKCYNPPRIKHGTKKENSFEKDTVRSPKPQSPPRNKKKVQEHTNNDPENTMETSKLTDSMLMDITVRSRDEIYGQDVNHNVPPLAITVDKDHMNWLQEQASKAEIRVRSSGRLKSSLHPDEELHPGSKYRSPRESILEENIKMEKQRKDEEQKYLAFAKEVTDDVLSRGISTDSVLYRVFENHIERRKDDLDEDRMRKVISDLRKNLGLKDSLALGQTVASLSDSNYNSTSKKEQGTRSNNSSGHQQTKSYKSVTANKGHQNFAAMDEHSEMGSTLESASTLKFGRTGDVLSTINSNTSREVTEAELDRLDDENEMTATQTLKQYQLSLTAKEERGDASSSARESSANGRNDTERHSFSLERPATGERRPNENGKFMSDVSNVRAQKISSEQSSHRRVSKEMYQRNRDDNMSFSVTEQHDSEQRNHGHSGEEISSSDKSITDTGNRNNTRKHKVSDDGDVSVKSSASSQRPTPRPRARARQTSYETAQGKTDVTTASVVTDEIQENETQTTRHTHKNVSTPDESNTIPSGAVLENYNTTENESEVKKHGEDNHLHQEPSEENDEYEDDYEEDIESEDNGQEDSADDF